MTVAQTILPTDSYVCSPSTQLEQRHRLSVWSCVGDINVRGPCSLEN